MSAIVKKIIKNKKVMFVNIISVLGVLVVFELGVRLFMLHNATFDERLLVIVYRV